MEHRQAYFRNQILFWSLGLLALILFVWLFKAILLPFVLGIAVAYLLNPMVRLLGRVGFGRSAATIVILSGFFILLTAILAVIVPILYKEISALIEDLPSMSDKITSAAAPYQESFQSLFGIENGDALSVLKEHAGASLSAGKTILSGLKAGGAAVTSFISVIVIMPIVAFFMMCEWPRMLKWMQDLMPRPHQDTIMDLLGQMDTKLAGFVRGQITVATMLGLIYAIGLSLAGLKYGFLIGFFAGVFSIIPMVGSTLGLLIGILVAWLQAGDLMFVGIIAAIFIVGQLVEGNFLTPKFVGDSVGLHPLWVFFALMAGGALFGIVGMLIAVPVAAVISVIAGFLLQQYKLSSYYLGMEQEKTAPKKKPMPKKTNIKQKAIET